jgi:hypothetical protein
MQRASSLKWILSAFFALALAIPTFAKDEEKNIKYRDLPEPVKKTVDAERGKDDVKMITHVVKGESEFYRVTINTKGNDKVIRVRPAGELIDATAAKDAGAEREASPSKAKAEEVRGSKAEFDTFPGKVKEATMREAKSYVTVVTADKYQHKTDEFYRTVVTDGNRKRTIIVKGDGSLYSDADDTDDAKKEVSYDKVPSAPRTAIGSEAGPNKVAHVYQITKEGKTYYRVYLDNGHEFVVDDAGKIGPAQAAPESKRK